MYLWKCWRDTRVKFFVAFVVVLLLLIPIVMGIHVHPHQKPWDIQKVLMIAFLIPGGLLWFVGWILSKENPGADIGRGSGDFLLTRPGSRHGLVWTGWMVGMVEAVVLWVVLSALLCGAIFLRLRLLRIPVWHGPDWGASPGLEVLLLFVLFLLNLGLIYGLAYCIGVIVRSGPWALIGSAIAIIGYGFLQSTLRHRWGIHLPDFLLPLHSHHDTIVIPSALTLAVHGCLLVAFPVLAHFVLERMEI